MRKILIVDNKDSFTYNLVEVLRQTKLCLPTVRLLSDVNVDFAHQFDGVIFSPGPGLPSEKKGLTQLIINLSDKKPLLGVCLGHQAIVEAFGGKIKQLKRIVHGESSEIKVHDSLLYNNMDANIIVGRYHSWGVETLPSCFSITAKTNDGLIMSIKHNKLNVCGVQYHPESILTPDGNKILTNWLMHYVIV